MDVDGCLIMFNRFFLLKMHILKGVSSFLDKLERRHPSVGTISDLVVPCFDDWNGDESFGEGEVPALQRNVFFFWVHLSLHYERVKQTCSAYLVSPVCHLRYSVSCNMQISDKCLLRSHSFIYIYILCVCVIICVHR